MYRFRILLAIAIVAATGLAAHAQTPVTLDATSGTNTISTSYTTTGGLTLNMGFFVDYLLVGGGGAGGNGGGGGGGGGILEGTGLQLSATNHSVSVGTAGAGGSGNGGRGGDSVFNSLTANGGGGGGAIGSAGLSGGSGGGGGSRSGSFGSATQGSPGFGFRGGSGGSGFDGGDLTGGGGGGGGAAGTNGSGGTSAGNGGAGRASTITGASVTYAGGGGGGRGNRATSGGTAGSGGGGTGGIGNTTSPTIGSDGRGGGGGGGGAVDGITYDGARGGSGVAVIRFAGAPISAGGAVTSFTGNGTIGQNNVLYQVHTFTGNGSFNLSGVNFNTRLGATLTGTLVGTGGLTYNGPGRLILNANNTYVGSTTISSGTLQIGSGGTTGSLGTGNVTNNAALVVNRSNDITLADAISGSGLLTQQGAGTTVLAGNNTYSGATTISAGTLQIGSGGTAGSLSTSSAIGGSAGATLAFARSDTVTQGTQFASVIGGAVNVSQRGSGTLVLNGANTYTGTTRIVAGSLSIGNALALQNSTLDLNAADAGTVSAIGQNSTLGGLAGTRNLDMQNRTLSIGSNNQSTTYSGTLSNGGLTKVGSGTLTLSGTNNYSGGTTVSAGRLIGTTDSLQGAITNDAAIEFSQTTNGIYSGTMGGTGSLTKTGAGTVTLTGTNAYSGGTTVSAGTLVGTTDSLQGAITNNAAVEFAQASDGTYVGVISGSGGLVKSDAGRLTLTGANTFTGATTVSAGTLATSAANRLSSSSAVAIATGAALELGGSQTLAVVTGSGVLNLVAGMLTLGATTGEFAGSITGSGDLVKSGAGTFTLSGSNTFTGDVTVSGGTLLLASDAALNAATDVTLTSGATLNVASGRTVRVNSFTLTQGTLAGPGALEALTTTVNAATIDTPIADAPGQSSNFVKTGVGTTTVNAANTFTGTVDVQAGTVQLGSGGSFSPSSSLQLAPGATLDLAGQSQTFAAVSGTGGTIALGAGTLTVNASTTNAFGGVIAGTGGLTKQGAGNLVLSGSSSYSGATSVAGGRLSVNGVLGTSPIAVLAAAELGGSGSIAGPVSIDAGGTLSPGNSIQSLATGTATFASGATFEYEVDSTDLNALNTAADLLVVNGDLDIASGTLLTFLDLNGTPNPFIEDTTIFAMINYSGSWNGGLFTYGANVLSDGERFMVGSQQWEIDYNRTSPTGLANFTGDYLPSSSFVAITAVPEPSTFVLIAIGAVSAACVGRRRCTIVCHRTPLTD